ncbi:uroporphyrinogen decarboxylase [Flammeovirga pectinis]|uniref:Uroporphyrinogen decarboxylase n=1 Tax=Flammeovirga pectinis TaxID=2494373 RepID=A0A3Q9FMT2_9BACT|nr:YgjV family protein [Flammeovirga pectinis]AZQ61261.1 uroporphyrinogen decarboxylase [Flammeovirga pectinis]
MEMNTEYIGYLASILLMISFSLKNVNKLRLINTLGCFTFVLYGYLLDAWPVVISNGFIATVNIFYLLKDKKNPSK